MKKTASSLRPVSITAMMLTAGTLQIGTSAAAQDSTSVIELSPIILPAKDGTSYVATTSATGTIVYVPVKQNPQSVTTVTPKALDDRAAASVDDALQTVSGVTQANTIAGKEDAVIRRGFGFSRDGSILTDGLKNVLPKSFNIGVESVDVLKGPASTLYGVLDPGGMVNLSTRKPQDSFAGRAYSSFEFYGEGRTGNKTGIDLTGPIEGTNLSYRLLAERENSDYWRNFGNRDVTTLAPSLRWSNGITDIDVSYMQQDYTLPYERGTIYDAANEEFLDIGRRTRLDEEFAETEGTSTLAKVTAKHDLDNGWNLSFGYAHSTDSFRADQVRVMGYDATTGTITRRADVRDYYDVTGDSARVDLNGDIMIAGLRNELLFGAAYDSEQTKRSQLQNCTTTSLDVNNITYGTTSACDFDASASSEEYETIEMASFYLQDRVHLNDQWIVVGGLRYQDYNITAGRGEAVNTDTEGGVFLPNLGVVWEMNEQFSLYANAARTFRPNSSMTSAYGDLEPEMGTSYEFGAKFALDNGLNGTLAFYSADKENVAYSETVNGETVYRTAGLVHSEGVELDIAGQLTDKLQLIASYGLTDARVEEDPDYAGKRLANVAMHTAALNLAYDHGEIFGGMGTLRYGGGVRFVGDRAGDNANTFELPAYKVVDVFAAYTVDLGQPVTFQLNLNNIFDETYYTSAIGNSAYGIAVGQPFNAALKVSVAF